MFVRLIRARRCEMKRTKRRKRQKRRRYTTYLAGPMQAVAHSGSGWRVFFAEMLKKYNVHVQDPVKQESKKIGLSATKAKALLKKYIVSIIQSNDHDVKRRFMRILNRMVRYDFKMVHSCDFMIAQVIEGVVSSGTQEEIIEASKCKIPVYVIYSGRPEYFPAWLLRRVLLSGGRVFQERKRNGFKECLRYLRNKFELEELENGDQYPKKRKKKKVRRVKKIKRVKKKTRKGKKKRK